MSIKKYYQPEFETMEVEDIKKLQSEKLVKQVKHVYDNVPHYRAKMEAKGVTPDDIKSIDDLYKLPFLEKSDLRDTYPYGILAKPLNECVRIHSTSGTTGKRVIAYYTQHDIDLWEDCCARALVAVGADERDIVQVSYGYGLFTGGAGLNGGSHKLGCLTLPMSSGSTERQLQFMTDLGATVLCCTPSYACYLGEALKEKGYTPDMIPLKAGIFGAEPWTAEMRRSIEETLGIKAYDIYGLAEIINPETGEVLPEGEKGELVFTCLDKEAFPVLRYRTRDICVLTRKKCSCGRTFIKMAKPMGRSDDMMIIRGVNVFPSQIETVLVQEGFTANYLIKLGRKNNNDTFDVFVELPPEQFDDSVKVISEREKGLQDALRTMLGISPAVHLVPPKTIARSEGKAVRIIDERKLHD